MQEEKTLRRDINIVVVVSFIFGSLLAFHASGRFNKCEFSKISKSLSVEILETYDNSKSDVQVENEKLGNFNWSSITFNPITLTINDSSKIKKPTVPYNSNLYFHTKLPKSGSTTMEIILKKLSKRNKFYFTRIHPDLIATGLEGEEKIIEFIDWFNETTQTISPVSNYNDRIVFMKHHFPFDFGKFGRANPTYFNVIREPTSWFQSHYYFERFGRNMNRKGKGWVEKGLLDNFHRDQSINECIENKNGQPRGPECRKNTWNYFNFICGNPDGNTCPRPENIKNEYDYYNLFVKTKKSLLRRFHVVGILEDFNRTLQLFEKMMPEIYSGVGEIINDQEVQMRTNSSSTKREHFVSLSDENVIWLKENILKYETDFYEFAKSLFYQQVREFGLV